MILKVIKVAHSRQLHTASYLNLPALDAWIATPKQLVLRDSLRPEHLSSLYVTLPTRAEHVSSKQPQSGTALGYGHHLVFFHPRNPESLLRPDGTDADFCPPEPFTRRMWAGGRITWNKYKPLIIGRDATAKTKVERITKKGFHTTNPMIFVDQTIDFAMDGEAEASVHEERAHVYLPISAQQTAAATRPPRQVSDLPSKADFTYEYTPTPTTLFRFSALTFNGHHIHLDKNYAQNVEGYPERLVHGPLSALMLLETLTHRYPTASIKSFEYRARNPLTVDKRLAICGTWVDKSVVTMWCIDQNGTVGMTGKVELDDNIP